MIIQEDPDFANLKATLKKLDFLAGSFIFQIFKKRTFIQWAPVIFFIFAYFLSLIFAYGTISQRQIILHVLEVILKLIFNSVWITFGMLHYHKSKVLKLIDWCAEIYNPASYLEMFGQSTYRIAKKHVAVMYRRTKFMLKWAPIILHADTTLATLVIGLFMMILPESIYQKYRLPVPYYLPFEVQETLGHYLTSVIGQWLCATSLSFCSSLVVGIFLTIVLHFLSYLDIIHDIIEKLGEEINQKQYISDEELENCSKIIVSMVSQLIQNVTILSDLYTFFFLLMEFAAMGSFIVFGLTFLVLRQQYAIGFSLLHVAVQMYMICFVSEKINDKFKRISDNIYGMKWYNLPPKQRTIILRTMLCGNIGLKFKAAGIHYVTPEKFGQLTKAAYSNCIILKNLLLK